MAFISNLAVFTFLVSFITFIYFIVKKDKRKRNISILVFIISFICVGVFTPKEEQEKMALDKKEKQEKIEKEKKEELKKSEEDKKRKKLELAEKEKEKKSIEDAKKKEKSIQEQQAKEAAIAESAENENKKKEAAEQKKLKDAADKDITILSEKPSDEQTSILQELAEQQFSERYPFKGSKINSILGVIQDWTQNGDHWFYKSEAIIVNAFGAKRSVNIEVTITPITANSGSVSIIDY